jgi:hypothetical protein
MTQTTTEPNPDPTVASEHLLHLHKMSTTAGLGSGEYVAVNVTAVLTIICGLASVLAILGNLLLVIPAVGTVLGICAIVQISRSNGTQTGRLLAWTGLILSVLIGGGLVTTQIVQAAERAQDEKDIAALAHQFGQLINEDKYDDAYDLFDSSFHSRWTLQQFESRLAAYQHSTAMPHVTAVEWNSIPPMFDTSPEGDEIARVVFKVYYTNMPEADREDARMVRADGVWRFDEFSKFFTVNQKLDTPPP